MTIHRFIQDPDTHKLVPAEEFYRPPVNRAAYVMDDLKPYRPIAGEEAEAFLKGDRREAKLIDGRKRHREFLRKNSLIEVGNEKSYMTRFNGKTQENHDYFANPRYKGHKLDMDGVKVNWETPKDKY